MIPCVDRSGIMSCHASRQLCDQGRGGRRNAAFELPGGLPFAGLERQASCFSLSHDTHITAQHNTSHISTALQPGWKMPHPTGRIWRIGHLLPGGNERGTWEACIDGMIAMPSMSKAESCSEVEDEATRNADSSISCRSRPRYSRRMMTN